MANPITWDPSAQPTMMTAHQNGSMTCKPLVRNYPTKCRVSHSLLTKDPRPHDAFLTMAKPYMAAWKANSLDVAPYITSDSLTYWYRSSVKGVECAATDNCEQPSPTTNDDYFIGKPNGWDLLNDNIFVVALLTEAGTVTVTSADNEPVSFQAQQGQNAFEIPFAAGTQKFELTRNGNTVLSGTSLKSIDTVCTCGFYNFNAYAGSLPASTPASLRSDAYSNFDAGLPSPTCKAQPSLYASSTSNTALHVPLLESRLTY